MTRLTKKAINAFKGRKAEEEIYGEEPAKLGAAYPTDRINMTHALNWYSQLSDVRTLRRYLEKYTANTYDNSVLSQIRELKDTEIPITLCSLAKMFLAGCKLNKDDVSYLNNRIQELAVAKVLTPDEPKPVTEKMNQLEADTDDFLDEFYTSGYKKEPIDYYAYLKETEAKPLAVRSIIGKLAEIREEIEELSPNYPRKYKKAYTLFVQKMIEDAQSYVGTVKRERTLTRKPRKPKQKSADQLTKRVQFKASDPALKLTSLPPAHLVGAQFAWLYNTRYKRLTYLESNEKLTVKGTTVIGFDEKISFAKRLRKPEKQLAEILNTTKLGAIKAFKALKTKPAPAKGRLNADVIILKTGR